MSIPNKIRLFVYRTDNLTQHQKQMIMKQKLLILGMAAAAYFTAHAQTMETAADRFCWNKKDTDPQPGYVVLKSGSRLEGIITIKGSRGYVNKIILNKDGKEIELPAESLSAYGLNVGPLISDSPDEMYEWRNMGSTSTMGRPPVSTYKSKEKRGYVILNDGTRVDGQLHLHKEDAFMDEIIVSNEKGKQVFRTCNVSHYGLIPTIADLTKGGKKMYDDAGRNFEKGYATQQDGKKLEGMLAFRSSSNIRNSDAVLYKTLYYAPSETEPVTVIPTENLTEVTQMFHDTAVVYLPYSGGFVDKSKISSLSINDLYKLFQPGSITLNNKSEVHGEIAQVFENGKEYCSRIKFKLSDNTIKEYGANDVVHFYQTINNQDHHFDQFEGVFVHLIYTGKTFVFYKNPHPKTINKRATEMARSAASLSASLGSAAAVNSMKGVSNEDKQKFNNSIQGASVQELKKTNDVLNDVKDSKLAQDEQTQANLSKAQGAIAIQEIGSTIADNLVIYNVEYYILNKKTNENKLMIKNEFGNNIEPLLKSCEKYLFLDKATQKKYLGIDNAPDALKLLDECYSK